VSERQHNRPGANYRAPLPEVGLPGGRQSQAVGLRPGLPAETAWRANPSCAAIWFQPVAGREATCPPLGPNSESETGKGMDGMETIPLWPRD
jgi:hypothetical protein